MANGILIYPITDGETAADVTNYQYEPLNVMRYGADPTGATDSTTAIQTALNVAQPMVVHPAPI